MIVAAWLQAFAAILQAGVAIALFLITKRYVALTDRLANSSEAQVELLRADRDLARQGNKDALKALADSIRDRLATLPTDTVEGRRTADTVLRAANVPTDAELQELRRLSATVGPAVAAVGNAVADHLAFLIRIIREVQDTPRERGYNYNRFDWTAWSRQLSEAQEALARLAL
jgi:hypothetical protein